MLDAKILKEKTAEKTIDYNKPGWFLNDIYGEMEKITYYSVLPRMRELRDILEKGRNQGGNYKEVDEALSEKWAEVEGLFGDLNVMMEAYKQVADSKLCAPQ